MRSLEKSILSTIAYFDVFDYPLTLMELWQWLYMLDNLTELRGLTIVDIRQVIDNSTFLQEKIAEKFGFYFLAGRENIVVNRLDRYRWAERKYHRAKQVIKFLRHVPFIRLIGICNTLAYNNSRAEADIDLFIITEPGRIWQVRFWTAGFLKLFGLRPTKQKKQDTICASFFADTDHLNLEMITIPQDIYLPYWVAQVTPVYDEGVYHKFIKDNQWIKTRLPYVMPVYLPPRRSLKRVYWLKKFLTIIMFLLPETVFKKYQLKIMPVHLRALANRDTRVIVKDYMLKFHDRDRRQYFWEEWQKRLKKLNF